MASESQLLRMASLSIHHSDHDDWNGGVDYYEIRLQVPLEVFVQIEPEIEEHEKRILEVAKSVWRDFESDIVSAIRVLPDRTRVSGDQPAPIAVGQLPAFWDEGKFRLFLSHCNSRKAEVGQLKLALGDLGVNGFVAHDDIEPSELWQTEIERALRTCEALAAVVSEDFSASLWCDQEIGFALGRGVPVLPIQCGKPPYGFIGRVQALPLPKGEALASRARHIVQLLLRSPQTSLSMTTALVRATTHAPSYANAKDLAALLESAPSLHASHAVILKDALKRNDQVSAAYGVPERLRGILQRHGF
ncbi:MAG TPA: toll/interleukin-1 receptor domain-containing protein [Terriglobales bacterium]|nr:toll/interleukin-1 receptor domain-containing protein [Terriglobales bacterium]